MVGFPKSGHISIIIYISKLGGDSYAIARLSINDITLPQTTGGVCQSKETVAMLDYLDSGRDQSLPEGTKLSNYSSTQGW